MGFLLGAFGKLQAGQRYRSIQAKMTRVQSKLRRATNQIKRAEDMISRQEKLATNSISLWTQSQNYACQVDLYSKMMGKWANTTPTTTEDQVAYNKENGEYTMALANAKAQIEMQANQMKQSSEDYFQNLKDSQLQALKDEEDLLNLEKDTLESQLQVAKADYDACKEMEKDGAQMFKPQYTAGQ